MADLVLNDAYAEVALLALADACCVFNPGRTATPISALTDLADTFHEMVAQFTAKSTAIAVATQNTQQQLKSIFWQFESHENALAKGL